MSTKVGSYRTLSGLNARKQHPADHCFFACD
jgi:hypothetical protein